MAENEKNTTTEKLQRKSHQEQTQAGKKITETNPNNIRADKNVDQKE